MRISQAPRRFGLAVAAVLPIAGLATLAGTSVLPLVAAADTPDIKSPMGVSRARLLRRAPSPRCWPVNSTTIQGWTVVTPSMIGLSGGSVDLTAGTYNGWGTRGRKTTSLTWPGRPASRAALTRTWR